MAGESPSRARLVLMWIAAVEERPWLAEFYDDVIIDHQFLPPGKALLIAPQPEHMFDLNVL